MLISKQHKKVVLNLRNVERVTTIIPTAKTFEYKGKTLVAVPHRDDETRVLRNLGFDVPAPITYYYQYPGKFSPYMHQLETSGFFTMNPRSFCLNGMGSGKTLSALWAFDYLRKMGKVNRLLVVAPLSTLERAWGDEIFSSFEDMTHCVVHGGKDKRVKLLRSDYDVYIINHDGIKNADVIAEINRRGDIDIVIIDEIAVFRNSGTDRWKTMRKLILKTPYVWGLTGTPTPNEPTDAWAQIRLINPKNVQDSRVRFRDTVMLQKGPFKWVPRDNAAETVFRAMQPAIRFSREECIDLPPTTYITRHAEMTSEQKALYKTMLDGLVAEYEAGMITASNEAIKASKLLQIACGAVYAADGSTIFLPSKPRMEAMLELVGQSESKSIVFVPFTGALKAVAEFLRNNGYSVGVISGQTAKGERDSIFSGFQKTAHPHIIVANAAAMAHGLTLTAASTTIWYAPPSSNEIYEQANVRTVRPGQKHNTLIAHLEGSAIERKAYDRLQKKGKMQGLLLDLMVGNRGQF